MIVSVILLLVTTVMIGLQRLYYKGLNQEKIQNNARTIADDVNQEIQTSTSTPAVAWVPVASTFSASFNNQPPTNYHVSAVCIGSVRYVYIIGLQVGTGSNQVAQALWRDQTPSGGCASGVPQINNSTPSDGGLEYIAAGSRLTNFQITQQGNGDYALSVSVAIGQDNILSTNTSYNAQCIGGSGDQYCATAGLKTEVRQRLQ